MFEHSTIYLDTAIAQLYENGVIDRGVLRACQSSKPPMVTAGDVVSYLEVHGSFADVPGCRRPGRIPDTLMAITHVVKHSLTPSSEKPTHQKRRQATHLTQEADFDFLTDDEREDVLVFREEHGHLPMFRILRYYLNREDATRNDVIMGLISGLSDGTRGQSLGEISQQVGLSRERVRQIAQGYVLPDQMLHASMWTFYVDHMTYFADRSHASYVHASEYEVDGLTFECYADILQRTTVLENVENRFLARRGWVREITAWVNRLTKLAEMPRSIDSRISIEGLAMGGSLDLRISLVVLNQIAPALGIVSEGPDAIVLPKNRLEQSL